MAEPDRREHAIYMLRETVKGRRIYGRDKILKAVNIVGVSYKVEPDEIVLFHEANWLRAPDRYPYRLVASAALTLANLSH